MTLRYKNNVAVTLASSITDTTTTLSLTPGDGAQLPVIASGTEDTFLLTLTDKNGNREIISICRRDTSSDTLYVGTGTSHQSAGNVAGRGQESTTALSVTYTDDHTIELCTTAAPLEAAVKYSDAGELTATTAEINSVVDGCTSTAAELSVIHSSSVSQADLVKLHAVTVAASAINTYCTSSTVLNTRTITAGTGLSGGGDLSANRTIAHAAHTGHVTGATALTIASGVVTGAMMAAPTAGNYCYGLTVGNNYTTSTSPTLVWSAYMPATGTVRIRWYLWPFSSYNTAYSRIYKNGSAASSTFSATSQTAEYYDISVTAGDTVSLYLWSSNASYNAYATCIGVCVGNPIIPCSMWAYLAGGSY